MLPLISSRQRSLDHWMIRWSDYHPLYSIRNRELLCKYRTVGTFYALPFACRTIRFTTYCSYRQWSYQLIGLQMATQKFWRATDHGFSIYDTSSCIIPSHAASVSPAEPTTSVQATKTLRSIKATYRAPSPLMMSSAHARQSSRYHHNNTTASSNDHRSSRTAIHTPSCDHSSSLNLYVTGVCPETRPTDYHAPRIPISNPPEYKLSKVYNTTKIASQGDATGLDRICVHVKEISS